MITPAEQEDTSRQFAEEAGRSRPGILREFVDFLRYNKKWWLAPIIIVLLLLSVIMFLGGTAAAPFIYPLL